MPTYELSIILKKMARPQVVETLKRTGQNIYNNEGYIRQIQSLGERRLPNIKTVKGERHTEGAYVLFECDIKTDKIYKINDEMLRDKSIIQTYFLAVQEEKHICPEEYDGELLSPAERPSIQNLITEGRKRPKFRKIWNDHTGLDYYPFHR